MLENRGAEPQHRRPQSNLQKIFKFRNMATVVSFGILFGQKKSINAISSIITSSVRQSGGKWINLFFKATEINSMI
jgi:hypothetical protein